MNPAPPIPAPKPNTGCPPRPDTHDYRLGHADAFRALIVKLKRDIRLAQNTHIVGDYQTYATSLIEWAENKLEETKST